ncbi:helix-turn-helix transcriptional regulator [Achromobacter xylosoxidans]
MRAHLATPMTLKDIARHAGASDTALTRLFQEHRDTTPMNALRALRLDAARQRLLDGACANVTEAALAVGFGHLGRFSSTTRKDSANCPGRPCAWRSDRGRAARAGSGARHSVPDAGPVSGTADCRSPDRRAGATGRPAR